MPEKKHCPAWCSVAICVAALVYFISPVDIVPDIVFGFGQLDDAAILALAAVHGVRAWKHYSAQRAARAARQTTPPPIDVEGNEL